MAAAPAGMAVAIVGSASAHRASTTVTLPAAKATFVMDNESKPCNNWGRYYAFHVGANATSVRRGLLQFDLSSIPAGAHIESATLSVYETIHVARLRRRRCASSDHAVGGGRWSERLCR